jgi:curved DNA-binding protein CbpA
VSVPEDRLDELDYYTLLGIEESATPDEVREAFHNFALRYHPDRHVGGGAEKSDRATEIYARGAEAYRVLLDPETRRRYDRGLRRGHLRFRPEDETPSSVRPPSGSMTLTRTLKAAPFARKAMDAIKREDWQSAHLNLRLVLQHEPDNELLKAHLAAVESKLQKK